ncbi:MAG: peptidase carboxypeptidase [Bryobacterales bacterium]|nr:peptidase carboxypeptidase [Bryobacterales bacterium]
MRTWCAAILCTWSVSAQSPSPITTPKEALGFNIGDDYQVATYTQLEAYWKKLATESDRMKLVDMGATAEGRRQYMAIVSSPENLRSLDKYKDIARRLALAEGLTDDEAHALARQGKVVVWIDGGLHASETVGSQQLMEMVYQMVSRNDPETTRLLDDVIQLYVQANPDGQELVANWYMREADSAKRSLNGLPRLYHKYIGHDDNRDFFLSAMPETTNMNRQMFLEWFPQIVYNHHQTGPAGAVVFIPPFRDPFNYNLDPLIPLSVEMLGSAMHSRLIAEGKAGSAMRSGSNYSTWWNGGLRTISYFHNMIGILTEIIGNPTPVDIPLVPDKQLPQGDWPLPIAPQRWHYRQSIDYDISQNRAVLDYASRYRETLLFNIYRMGRNSIEKGSQDSWTITPKRIEALRAAAAQQSRTSGGPLAATLYDTVLHDSQYRDPRGYVIPSNQDDFPTAVEFVNALLKTGITVLRSTAEFQAAGKSYPAGSFVVKTAQAFRPHVLDMFEPQDHPNDMRYPGGPPVAPYDIAGWTLALQMGIKYDRILDAFDGPFAKVNGLVSPPVKSIQGPENPAGYLISHRINNSFTLVNRLLKAGSEVYWLKRDGTIWVPASSAARAVLEKGAAELGVPVEASTAGPGADILKLKPVRIGLYDQYGGLAPSGWTRWLFEQFEFPFEVVYPQTLDKGDLNRKYDVLVLTDGAFRKGGGGSQPSAATIPAEYRGWLGQITEDKTVPQLKQFVQAGGTLITIGSSTGLARLLGLPVSDPLAGLSRDTFYVPGSLMRATVDTTNPLAFGMGPEAIVFFDNSPVFRLDGEGRKVAWFAGKETLASGWAWGQEHLDGSTAVAEAKVGAGKVVLFGPEIAFRGQPHGTFKLLFNALY